MGAQVIEKHFKIDDQMKCVDASVSITENNMKLMVDEIRVIESILGDNTVDLLDSELEAVFFRRKTN